MNLVVPDPLQALESDLDVGDVVLGLLDELQLPFERHLLAVAEPVANDRFTTVEAIDSEMVGENIVIDSVLYTDKQFIFS